MISFHLEQRFDLPVIGVDEAGRGPWAGPLVVAAVMFRSYDNLPNWVYQLDDSKKLSITKRQTLFKNIQEAPPTCLRYAIHVIPVATIDRVNILQATMEGMRLCIQSLRTQDAVVLIDGNQKPVQEDWCYPVVKGDSKSLSIAAASVLAKVHRDHLMRELSKDYPQYGWDKNAGYGTAQHQAALKEYGITPHHRKSFAPIRVMSV